MIFYLQVKCLIEYIIESWIATESPFPLCVISICEILFEIVYQSEIKTKCVIECQIKCVTA